MPYGIHEKFACLDQPLVSSHHHFSSYVLYRKWYRIDLSAILNPKLKLYTYNIYAEARP